MPNGWGHRRRWWDELVSVCACGTLCLFWNNLARSATSRGFRPALPPSCCHPTVWIPRHRIRTSCWRCSPGTRHSKVRYQRGELSALSWRRWDASAYIATLLGTLADQMSLMQLVVLSILHSTSVITYRYCNDILPLWHVLTDWIRFRRNMTASFQNPSIIFTISSNITTTSSHQMLKVNNLLVWF